MSDVVFIGSSQSVTGTWPEQFSSAMGFTPHNYSVAGGGFTASGAGQFLAQINAAIADTCYDHANVSHVFICDMGNDIRATWSITPFADAVFHAAQTAYPNAQLILLPCMWGDAPSNSTNAGGNNISGRITSISDRIQEARNAGLPYSLRIVPWSWTWMADATALGWMRPGEVHYTAAGYQRVAQFMVTYMRGGDTRYDVGWYTIPAKPAVVADTAYWQAKRDGNQVSVLGPITLPAAVGVDVEFGQLSYGTWPVTTVYATAVNAGDRMPYSVAVFPNGLIRSFGPMPAGTYILNLTFSAF